MKQIKIGYNPAANMLPIFYFLDKSDPLLKFVSGFPARHNHLLSTGEIDMAPISAFSYGQYWQKYTVLSGLSVSAKGRIGSILLYSKVPLEQLDGRTIALTNTSASSVNLLRIILAKFYHIKPNYINMSPNLTEMLANADAALLIADEALMGLSKNTGCRVFDLGEEWYKHTGLSMTFSVWAVNNAVIQDHPSEVAAVQELLFESTKLGYQNTNKIIDHCIGTLGEDYAFWSIYFSQLRHDLQPDLLDGLSTYFRFCTEMGLLPSQPQIKLFPDNNKIFT